MAKHIFRREDEGRTELLGQDELFVQKGKGSDTYYNAWLHDPEIECCPRCGSYAVKTQDLFSKTYLDLVSEGEMSATKFQLETYKQQIAAHVEHRGLVPERLHALTSRLENLISSMRTFSDEVLKARILYTVEADLEHWSGVPLDDVLAVFDQQVHSNGGNE